MEEQVKIFWSSRATKMLNQIHAYISERSELAADKYVSGLRDSTKRLTQHPESCAPCRNPILHERGYRCCIYRNHLIVYKFIENEVRINSIVSSRMNPERMGDLVD